MLNKRPLLIKNIIDLICGIFIALFVYTGISKLTDWQNFNAVLWTSPLIGQYSKIVAWSLPITELLVSVLLIIPRTRTIGLLSTLSLMVIFTSYIAYMIVFTPNLPCSCGGILSSLSWRNHLALNCFLTLLAIVGLLLIKRDMLDSNNKNTPQLT